MTNDFICIELKPGKNKRGGSFVARLDFTLDNFPIGFNNIKAKIDTGCTVSTIPVRKLRVSEQMLQDKKQRDIEDKIPYLFSYGVESGGTKHIYPKTREDMQSCEAVKFRHNVQDFYIEDLAIPVSDIYLNYNRSGNILIGMDIIELLDSHMGISKKSGKMMFIACPRNLLNDNYYRALSEHFSL